MQSFIDKHVTVVLRTVDERTTETCHALIKQQIAENNIIIVNEMPFTEALRKTFVTGLEGNRKWTFVVDADILLLPGTIKRITEHAETVNDNIFKIEGTIIDKFIDSPRSGMSLYRTGLMEQALSLIPKPQKAIRPETEVRNLMCTKGYHFDKSDVLLGFHDFEQYYRDIYRKSFVQSKKHNLRTRRLLNQWRELSIKDSDYKVALRGFADGDKFDNNVAIDAKSGFMDGFNQILNELSLHEKNKLHFGDFDTLFSVVINDLSAILQSKESDLAYLRKIQESRSYQIGRFITAPFRKILGYTSD